MKVTNLKQAYAAYWNAPTLRDEHAAYHEILLFGGKDGFPNCNKWRQVLARHLRRLALFVERRDLRMQDEPWSVDRDGRIRRPTDRPVMMKARRERSRDWMMI